MRYVKTMLPRVLSDWQDEKYQFNTAVSNMYESLYAYAIKSKDETNASEYLSTWLHAKRGAGMLSKQINERSSLPSPFDNKERPVASLVMTDSQVKSLMYCDSMILASDAQMIKDLAESAPFDVMLEHAQDWECFYSQKTIIMNEVIEGDAMDIDGQGLPLERVLSEYPQPNDRDWMSARPKSPILASRKDWIPAHTGYPKWRMLKNTGSSASPFGPMRKAKSPHRSVSPIEKRA